MEVKRMARYQNSDGTQRILATWLKQPGADAHEPIGYCHWTAYCELITRWTASPRCHVPVGQHPTGGAGTTVPIPAKWVIELGY